LGDAFVVDRAAAEDVVAGGQAGKERGPVDLAEALRPGLGLAGFIEAERVRGDSVPFQLAAPTGEWAENRRVGSWRGGEALGLSASPPVVPSGRRPEKSFHSALYTDRLLAVRFRGLAEFQ